MDSGNFFSDLTLENIVLHLLICIAIVLLIIEVLNNSSRNDAMNARIKRMTEIEIAKSKVVPVEEQIRLRGIEHKAQNIASRAAKFAKRNIIK